MSDNLQVAIKAVLGGPPGTTLLAASNEGIVQVQLGGDQKRFIQALQMRSYSIGGEEEWVYTPAKQLEEYFQGCRTEFQCRIVFPAMTPFSLRVYESLKSIPYGSTTTYGRLAGLAGHPKAARAVGRLMATNPWPIFIPCHRVLAAGGLGGFGGGLELKSKFLDLEQTVLTDRYPSSQPDQAFPA